MSLVLVSFDKNTQEVDLVEDDNGFISLGSGLETVCLLSLFSRRRAPAEEQRFPPFGWWGDTYADAEGDQWGSHLWLLQRRGLTVETVRLAQRYSDEALGWMVEDEIASSIVVSVEKSESMLEFSIAITRPNNELWSAVWKVHADAL